VKSYHKFDNYGKDSEYGKRTVDKRRWSRFWAKHDPVIEQTTLNYLDGREVVISAVRLMESEEVGRRGSSENCFYQVAVFLSDRPSAIAYGTMDIHRCMEIYRGMVSDYTSDIEREARRKEERRLGSASETGEWRWVTDSTTSASGRFRTW
jgi:hypothetical protein